VQPGSRIARYRCIRQAHLQHGYTLTEIGAYLGLHYSTVSKVVNEERRR
jgi:DNA-binding MarR family transcriptional regulator